MIRVVVFLVLTAAFAKYVAIWLADHPGEVSITWLGYHAEPPIGILVAGVATVGCATILLWSALRLLFRAPRQIASTMADRRAALGQMAIVRGLLAIGAGDVGAARRFAAKAGRLAPHQPLLLMLRAQTAQLSGEPDCAAAAFRAMTDRSETRLFGLHGLFIEAQRRNDPAAARQYAEDAAKASPSLAWAGQAALEFRCRDGDWSGALAALERNRTGGLVRPDAFRRQRAVLLTAQALSLKDRDAGTASELAQEAVRLCPGLVPAVALAGRLLAEAGEQRKAARILEAGWRESPHPDIANAYADLVPGTSARDRLIRMRVLAKLADAHPESALALANAALEAHEFAEAGASLAPLSATPTRRVATLMARIEAAEHGDTGLVREWMARAVHAALDPAWTADGVIAETWMPVSPVTGRLDAFQWRVPVADLTPRGPVIDQAERTLPMPSNPIPLPSNPMPPPQAAASPISEAPVKPLLNLAKQADGLPLHAPDDPGPEPEPILEPEPKRSGAGGKMRSWFFSSLLH
ncbi:MAG TPA: heme biosynthesis HemY N-terminal domain-containing protein [Xanthobacteraceae bacterium]|nr:heme biosynthesis HemY N-terminal domain-containing protein [Xanthobacteraceae bacterium]